MCVWECPGAELCLHPINPDPILYVQERKTVQKGLPCAWVSCSSCDSNPPYGRCIHPSSWKPSSSGHQGKRWCENQTCCILFEDCINPLSHPTDGRLRIQRLNIAQEGGHTHHRNTWRKEQTCYTSVDMCMHTPHMLVQWMKADIRPCLQQEEVGDTVGVL